MLTLEFVLSEQNTNKSMLLLAYVTKTKVELPTLENW